MAAITDIYRALLTGEDLTQANLERLLGPGAVFRRTGDTALSVRVNPAVWQSSSGLVSLAPTSPTAITNNQTTHIYIDSAGVLQKATSLPGSGEYFYCGRVVSSGGVITEILNVNQVFGITGGGVQSVSLTGGILSEVGTATNPDISLTAAAIETAYEALSDTNKFTDDDEDLLNEILALSADKVVVRDNDSPNKIKSVNLATVSTAAVNAQVQQNYRVHSGVTAATCVISDFYNGLWVFDNTSGAPVNVTEADFTTLTASMGTSGLDGLASSLTEASATFYYLWAVHDPVADDTRLSISDSPLDPKVDSDYTHWLLLEQFYNDGSSDIVEQKRFKENVVFTDPLLWVNVSHTTSYQTASTPAQMPIDNTVSALFLISGADSQTGGLLSMYRFEEDFHEVKCRVVNSELGASYAVSKVGLGPEQSFILECANGLDNTSNRLQFRAGNNFTQSNQDSEKSHTTPTRS